MGLYFCSFSSGSSGNCYMIKSEETTILVDVGIAGKWVLAGLEENALEAEDVDGILLTHEHIDHVRSIRMIGRLAENATVYGSAGTFIDIQDKLPKNRHVAINGTESFQIGDITVKPFDLSHDAVEPMGYSLLCEGKQITIVTDTGMVTDEIFQEMRKANLLVLEANHEVNILRVGPYPYPLKQRILGDQGHLSNETAGNLLVDILDQAEGEWKPQVLLAHLSKENNTPQQAYLTVKNILFEKDYMDGRDLFLSVIRRDQITPLIKVR